MVPFFSYLYVNLSKWRQRYKLQQKLQGDDTRTRLMERQATRQSWLALVIANDWSQPKLFRRYRNLSDSRWILLGQKKVAIFSDSQPVVKVFNSMQVTSTLAWIPVHEEHKWNVKGVSDPFIGPEPDSYTNVAPSRLVNLIENVKLEQAV